MTASKLVWSEGTYLSQQHFQQWDLLLQQDLQQKAHALQPFAWGVMSVSLMTECLPLGQIKCQYCEAIFPNGQYIQYDHRVDPPLQCTLNAEQDKLILYLAIANNHQVSGINGYQEKFDHPAWQGEYQETKDIYDGDRRCQILFGQLRLTLLQTGDITEQYSILPIASFNKNDIKGYHICHHYVPICLSVSASDYLQQCVEEILALLTVTIADNIQQHQHIAKHAIAQDQYLLASFYQAHYSLSQMAYLPTHPKILYDRLAALFFQLTVSFSNGHVEEIPVYQHQCQADIFPPLIKKVKQLLSLRQQRDYGNIVLKPNDQQIEVATDIPPQLLANSQTLFLVIKGGIADKQIMNAINRNIKIASLSMMDQLIKLALPGLEIRQITYPPSNLVVEPNCDYFQLKTIGPLWDAIIATATIALYRTTDYKDFTIQLLSLGE